MRIYWGMEELLNRVIIFMSRLCYVGESNTSTKWMSILVGRKTLINTEVTNLLTLLPGIENSPFIH
jgi:hypothetical protein